jgi:hypothetical protein
VTPPGKFDGKIMIVLDQRVKVISVSDREAVLKLLRPISLAGAKLIEEYSGELPDVLVLGADRAREVHDQLKREALADHVQRIGDRANRAEIKRQRQRMLGYQQPKRGKRGH